MGERSGIKTGVNKQDKWRAQPGNKKAQKHGLNPLKKAVYTLGNRAIDKRTSAGRALAEWRDALIRDLGGDVSIQHINLKAAKQIGLTIPPNVLARADKVLK